MTPDGEIIETDDVKDIEGMDKAEKDSEETLKRREKMLTSVNAKELINAEISGEMRSAYLNYAMSVIVARALPDVRD